MRLKGFLFLLAIGSVLITGCAQKTKIKAIKAAKVSDGSIRNIGVLPFKNDDISQSSQIDAAIAGATIDGKKYFNLVDRDNLKKVMEEKRLNESGIVDLVKDDSDSGIAQMESFLSGKVDSSTVSSSKYRAQRTDYDTCVQYKKNKKGKTYCAKYRKYYVSCQANTYRVQTKVKVTRVSDSRAIFGKTYSASSKRSHCTDDSYVLPSKSSANTALAGKIARQLMVDIAPSYIYFTVTLLEDPDIDYSDAQKKQLENSLALIDKKRVEKANEILKYLNDSLGGRSYVALYDLGITEEALGNVEEAYNLFKKAETISLMTDMVEEISEAVVRAEKNLNELKKAQEQMK